jgi:hypothetical protein
MACSIAPDPEIDAKSVMKNHLEFDSRRNILEGALLYKIQVRRYVKSVRSTQDESECIQLLVAWRVGHTKEPGLYILLIRHDKKLDWNEHKLKWLYQEYWNLLDTQVNSIGRNWLLLNDKMVDEYGNFIVDHWLSDDIVVLTEISVRNECRKWDISISGGTRDNNKILMDVNFERPLWIDAER